MDGVFDGVLVDETRGGRVLGGVHCPLCNRGISVNDEFCVHCGTPIESEALLEEVAIERATEERLEIEVDRRH